MEDFERELLISRILSGYVRCHVNDKVLLVHSPDIDTVYESNEIYAKTLIDCKNRNVWNKNQALQLLYDIGEWTEEDEEYFNHGLPDQIEYFKVQLYNTMFKSDEHKKIRKYLAKAKETLDEMSMRRSQYDHITDKGAASLSKLLYTIQYSTTYLDGTPCNWEEIPFLKLVSEYQNHHIEDAVIRQLSRTDPWISFWQAHKIGNNLFRQEHPDIYQKRLISWSLLYDTIGEAAEPPPSSVIQDDDMLDGWLIIQRKKREEEENKQAVESKAGNDKISNASEIYIQVDNISDARKVNAANDPRAQATKKQRFDLIKQRGKVKQHEFADVKMERQMQANQASIESMKGR